MRATGVEVVDPEGRVSTVGARHVVVAGGAVETPRLLLLSGLEHPLIGRYLMVHFQTISAGSLAERLHPHRGRAVTHVHDDAVLVDADAGQAARSAGLPWLRGGMVEHGGASLPIMEAKLYPWGRRHRALMAESPLRDRLWAFTMQGEDLAYPTNTIDLDPTVRDARGFPVARMTYRAGRHELAASAHHAPKLEAVLREMGAQWARSTTSPGTGDHKDWSNPVPESRHVMGTTRMGTDPGTSVVDPFGRLHGLDNVLVADSSVFVTSSGYGPTLTLVALAARNASALAGIDAPSPAPASASASTPAST